MIIPRKLKVGGKTFTVEVTDTRDERKEGNNWGKTNFSLLKIYIDADISEEVREETFLHEILHTATDFAGIPQTITNMSEEELVDRLSRALYPILKDNKLLK